MFYRGSHRNLQKELHSFVNDENPKKLVLSDLLSADNAILGK